VPLWGFAEVVSSRAPGVEVGARVYGFLPTASHLLVRPDRADGRGFRDAAEHRAALPAAYNAYALTSGDPSYDAAREDLQVLFRPLFLTSFLLADQLQETPGTVVLSSASSKTAYGAAFLLRARAARSSGSPRPATVAFTESLGCYDRVLTYDDAASLPREDTAYVDLAGSTPLRQALHTALADRLLLRPGGRVTHQDSGSAGRLPGPRPTVFFAPDRLQQRSADWGRAGFDERFAQAWGEFVPAVHGWVDVTPGTGPQGLQSAYLEVLAGRSDPRTGHVLQL
jgi:hypothetical protein